MRLHRFLVQDPSLGAQVELTDTELLHQWMKVLRFHVGEHVVLFDGKGNEGEYRIDDLGKHHATLARVQMRVPRIATKNFALLWSLLKKDKNEWVLQKATEIGVTHFLPIYAERTEKTGFPIDRATKIVREAVEQSGRADIPEVHEPMVIYQALQEWSPTWQLVALDEGGIAIDTLTSEKPLAMLVGPEGGWSEREKNMFKMEGIPVVSIGAFTLRGETAAIVGSALMIEHGRTQ